MNVVVQPSDVTGALSKMGAFTDPKGVAGKLVGMGRDELNAGVPTWAFCVAAAALGIFVGARYRDSIPGLRDL